MAQFRKKPVVVEAIQFNAPGDHPAVIVTEDSPTGFGIMTLEHTKVAHEVTPGDWIITGVKGECYACKPDIFASTYEPAHAREAGAQEPVDAGGHGLHTNPGDIADMFSGASQGVFVSSVTKCVFTGLTQQAARSDGWIELNATGGPQVLLAPGSVLYDVTVSSGGLASGTHPAPAQEPVAVPAEDNLIEAMAKAAYDWRAGILTDEGEVPIPWTEISETNRRRWLATAQIMLKVVNSAAPVSPAAEPTPDLVETVATGRDGVQRRVYVDRARGVVMEASPPAESGEVEDPWREAGEKQVQVHEALQDSAYRAGARAGWNAQFADEPDAAIERLTRYPKGALSIIHEKRAYEKITSSNPPAAKTGVVKLLDMSNLLKHAWQAGKNGVEWVDYDPDDTPAYGRISSALASHTPAPQPGGYHIPEPAGGWRKEFATAEKLKLRPIAETLAMLDGNAFFGLDWHEAYLPEASALYEANGGDTGWAGRASFAAPQPGGVVKVMPPSQCHYGRMAMDCAWPDCPCNQAESEPEPVQSATEALIASGNKLAFAAQTSGGVAGRDEGLCEAIEGWTKARDAAAIEPSPSQWNAGAEATKAAVLRELEVYISAAEKSPYWNDGQRDAIRPLRDVIAALPLPTPAGEG